MVKNTIVVLRAKSTPCYARLVLILGGMYLLSPWDLIPEWLPVVGLLDDFALAALLIAWAERFRPPVAEQPVERLEDDGGS
ncbi:MAG: DUF1232 domain-containing protein [Candidatus Electrothrix sp. AR3]|nr:DUF1232 domain-containing protein [Candidatus Electrothrix sp. AR3]